MPGNSQRRGRRVTSKKGATAGSGGKNRAGLTGRGQTLPADERPWHKGYSGTEKLPQRTAWKQDKERRAAAEEAGRPRSVRRAPRTPPGVPGRRERPGRPGRRCRCRTERGRRSRCGRRSWRGGRGGAKQPTRSGPRVAPGRKSNPTKDAPELLVGRNPVVEALRANVPATALYIAQGIDIDDRVNEIVRTAGDRGIPILEVSRAELDRMTGGVLHQGVGLQVPPFAYESFDDLVTASLEQTAPLLVALDGVTDPRNLGAVIRSAAAFGAQGVFVPERRAAGITATAWRTSAGAAARVPVSQVTNLTRSLKACQEAGFIVVGLDADGETDLYDLEAAVGPLVVVVGSEGRGLSRLVGETCDLRVSIPMMSDGRVAERQRRRRGDAGRGCSASGCA